VANNIIITANNKSDGTPKLIPILLLLFVFSPELSTIGIPNTES
jgi:hypothetical protein